MGKRQIEFHDVVVRFAVRADTVPSRVAGFPAVMGWLTRKFGRPIGSATLADLHISSEERRSAVAIIARCGLGGNDMNCLDVEDITIEVDGAVLIDETGDGPEVDLG